MDFEVETCCYKFWCDLALYIDTIYVPVLTFHCFDSQNKWMPSMKLQFLNYTANFKFARKKNQKCRSSYLLSFWLYCTVLISGGSCSWHWEKSRFLYSHEEKIDCFFTDQECSLPQEKSEVPMWYEYELPGIKRSFRSGKTVALHVAWQHFRIIQVHYRSNC